MFFGSSITSMAATLLAVLLAITLHELAHGYVAYCLGDNTAKAAGRLTLNPLAHLDPIGALMMLIAGFGWAKPVPVNPFFFKGNRTTGMMLVSLAGPLVNLIVAYIAYAVYVAGQGFYTVPFLNQFLNYCIILNVFLAVFNLIPIPPLDGSKILAGFLPKQTAFKFLTTMERYGFVILMVLILFNITDMIIQPIAYGILNFYGWMLNLIF
ncbi:MAG: site-2 protease family protein [Peptococcaceae bacterium]|nr:site-2 protease family protein [Peptococcaceae bacterium]MBO5366249.1 site-2 protease family protein [Peptococcaceae bacterium]MBQ2837538.1 site-2 protease family protein [Peptococcaceae bacterium]MBQ2905997.1 site-2 protease family protein [Peptococcaceae bacterium]MBQ6853662.1 site-2 protease family protein [Peptococcaceae bacterium]